jgi:hypothetical protein
MKYNKSLLFGELRHRKDVFGVFNRIFLVDINCNNTQTFGIFRYPPNFCLDKELGIVFRIILYRLALCRTSSPISTNQRFVIS